MLNYYRINQLKNGNDSGSLQNFDFTRLHRVRIYILCRSLISGHFLRVLVGDSATGTLEKWLPIGPCSMYILFLHRYGFITVFSSALFVFFSLQAPSSPVGVVHNNWRGTDLGESSLLIFRSWRFVALANRSWRIVALANRRLANRRQTYEFTIPHHSWRQLSHNLPRLVDMSLLGNRYQKPS